MEIAKLVLEYVKVLAWPSAILTIVFIFRRQIESLVKRLEKADLPGGVSISLRAEILEAQELSNRVSLLPQKPKGRKDLPPTEANLRMIKLGLQPSPSGLNVDYYREILETDPNLALSGLRLEVEVLIKNLAQGFGVHIFPQDAGGRLVDKLQSSGAITSQQAEFIRKILKLTNASVHGGVVSRYEAAQIIDIASDLVDEYISWLSWGFDDGWQPEQGR